MALELIFNVSGNADKKTRELQKELQKLNVSLKSAEKANKGLDLSFAKLATGVFATVGVFKALDTVYTSVLTTGLAYNKEIEQQEASIRTLISATSDNVDSLGNVITQQEKYALASREATEALEELERINANTPNTLGQTAQIYKTLLPSMRAVGATSEDLISLTEKLSISANAGGIEFQSLLAGVDGLATGTVLANSDLGRFLSSIGLTNKELKASTDVVGLLNEKLGEFEALDTIAVATSNLTVEWQKLTGALTKDIFFTQKESIKELTKLVKELNENKEQIKAIESSIKKLANTAISSASAFVRFANGATILFSDIVGGTKIAFKSVEFLLLNLEKEFLEFSRSIRDSAVEILGEGIAEKLGIIDTTRTVDSLTQSIKLTENAMKFVGLEVNEIIEEMTKTKEEGFAFNQVVLDIERNLKTIVNKEREVTKEIEKQNKARTVAGKQNVSNIGAEQPFSQEFLDHEKLDEQLDAFDEYRTELINLGRSQADIEKELLEERFADFEGFIDKSSVAYENYANKIKELDLQIAENAKKATQEKLLASDNFTDGFIVAQEQMQDSAKTNAELGRDAYVNFANSSADALANFVTTGKADFGDFAKSVIKDLIKIYLQQQITGLFASSFGFSEGGAVGFAGGGYTGSGGKYEPAGIVHKGEVVFSQDDVKRNGGVAVVEAMRRGTKGYANGGYVGNSTTPQMGGVNIVINNNADTTVQAQERRDERGNLEVQIDILDKRLSSRIAQGTSDTGAVIENIYSLGRGKR